MRKVYQQHNNILIFPFYDFLKQRIIEMKLLLILLPFKFIVNQEGSCHLTMHSLKLGRFINENDSFQSESKLLTILRKCTDNAQFYQNFRHVETIHIIPSNI